MFTAKVSDVFSKDSGLKITINGEDVFRFENTNDGHVEVMTKDGASYLFLLDQEFTFGEDADDVGYIEEAETCEPVIISILEESYQPWIGAN